MNRKAGNLSLFFIGLRLCIEIRLETLKIIDADRVNLSISSGE